MVRPKPHPTHFLLYLYGCSVCVSVCAPCAHTVPEKTSKRVLAPLQLQLQMLGAAVWELGTESQLLGQHSSPENHLR